ncbi:YcxB family protein [Aureimonas psammosilenae]|uniref:YcxB family protein n=1 Tax=Aureimonas psammosilenae TaxID=2495496 RepID=UPI001260F259|nr:YcxB family protein [Aureimonas psammosilenae]
MARGILLAADLDPERMQRSVSPIAIGTAIFLIALGSFSIWHTDARASPIAASAVLPVIALAAFLALLLWIGIAGLARSHVRMNSGLLAKRGVPDVLSINYEFMPTGILARIGQRQLFQPSRSFSRLAETAELVVLVSHAAREPVILPKDQLSEDQIASAKRWADVALSQASSSTSRPSESAASEEDTSRPGVSQLRYILKEEDHLQEILHSFQRFYTPGTWVLRVILPWLLLCLAIQMVPMVIWAIDLRRPPLSIAMADFVDGFPWGGWIWAAVAAVGAIGFYATRSPSLRSYAQGMKETVYASDSDYDEVVVELDADGALFRQADYRDLIPRSEIAAIEERPDHLVIVTRSGAHYALPKRAFVEDTEEVVRRLSPSPTA